MVCDSFEAALLIRRGQFESGLAAFSAVLDTYGKTGWKPGYPQALGLLAECLAGLGRHAEAAAALDKALAAAENGGECWYVPELLRLKGEFLLREAGDDTIASPEALFGEALELSRQQGALSWQLRAAVSLARLRVRQARPAEARQILAPVYKHFTEGFDTPDLCAARGLLETL